MRWTRTSTKTKGVARIHNLVPDEVVIGEPAEGETRYIWLCGELEHMRRCEINVDLTEEFQRLDLQRGIIELRDGTSEFVHGV